MFFLIILILFFSQCSKNNSKAKEEEENTGFEETTSNTIDFNAMKKLLDNSKELNIEVFFAISVLHKKYVSQFENQAVSLSEDQQREFYHQKKIEFFKSIKYTEEEYDSFMQNHIEEMNEYINEHKAIREYLISIN